MNATRVLLALAIANLLFLAGEALGNVLAWAIAAALSK